jgi:hypothetical protein
MSTLFLKSKDKNKFIGTKTVVWDSINTIIKIEPGTFIKNIRMINAETRTETVTIIIGGNSETLHLIAFPVYRYLYNIKQELYIPFYLNVKMVQSDIEIVLDQKITGHLRYDIYENNTEIKEIKNVVTKFNNITGNVKAFIKWTTRDLKEIKTVTEVVIPPAFSFINGETSEIVLLNNTKILIGVLPENIFSIYETPDQYLQNHTLVPEIEEEKLFALVELE